MIDCHFQISNIICELRILPNTYQAMVHPWCYRKLHIPDATHLSWYYEPGVESSKLSWRSSPHQGPYLWSIHSSCKHMCNGHPHQGLYLWSYTAPVRHICNGHPHQGPYWWSYTAPVRHIWHPLIRAPNDPDTGETYLTTPIRTPVDVPLSLTFLGSIHKQAAHSYSFVTTFCTQITSYFKCQLPAKWFCLSTTSFDIESHSVHSIFLNNKREIKQII